LEAARAASAADLPALVELARALRAELRVERGGHLWETREAAPEPLVEMLRDALARDDQAVVVGTIDGVVLAYGIVTTEPLRDGTRLGVIGELYVDPGARAVGVGEVVAEQLVAFCAAAGCIGVDSTALPGQRETKNFFERSGFTARALTMHKTL
jgi:GNAT superfamily N-acetyltransferase